MLFILLIYFFFLFFFSFGFDENGFYLLLFSILFVPNFLIFLFRLNFESFFSLVFDNVIKEANFFLTFYQTIFFTKIEILRCKFEILQSNNLFLYLFLHPISVFCRYFYGILHTFFYVSDIIINSVMNFSYFKKFINLNFNFVRGFSYYIHYNLWSELRSWCRYVYKRQFLHKRSKRFLREKYIMALLPFFLPISSISVVSKREDKKKYEIELNNLSKFYNFRDDFSPFDFYLYCCSTKNEPYHEEYKEVSNYDDNELDKRHIGDYFHFPEIDYTFYNRSIVPGAWSHKSFFRLFNESGAFKFHYPRNELHNSMDVDLNKILDIYPEFSEQYVYNLYFNN